MRESLQHTADGHLLIIYRLSGMTWEERIFQCLETRQGYPIQVRGMWEGYAAL